MEKQTTPPINAHLLRGALILVSLVAGCMTPFALIGGVSGGGFNARAVARTIDGATPSGSPCAVLAYIPNSGSNNMSVIDTSTNTVVATVPVGANPQGVALNPAGTRAYITNGTSDTVSVIDTATNSVTASIPVGNVPSGVAVNPAGTLAYVANSADNTVSVIDTSTNTVVATVDVGHGPVALGNFIGALPCLGGTPPPGVTPRPRPTPPPRP